MLSHQLIRKFHFKCGSVHWDRFNVDSWIEIAKRHPLENLCISCSRQLILSGRSIFSFPTLVVLKLTRLKVAGNISVDLPSLKTLYLDQVYIMNQENFSKLLSGCPILEELHTRIHYREEDRGVSTDGFQTLIFIFIWNLFLIWKLIIVDEEASSTKEQFLWHWLSCISKLSPPSLLFFITVMI